MSQLTDNSFVERCHRAVLTIKDPVELQAKLREMVEAEYPVAPPPFAKGEMMPLYRFIARFQHSYSGGVAPVFYNWPVIADFDEVGDLRVVFAGTRIAPAGDPKPLTPHPSPLTSEAKD